MRRRIMTILLAIALITPIAMPQVNVVDVTTVSKAATSFKAHKKKVFKKYKKIKKGMTYKKVCKILGKKGECYQSGTGWKNYSWDFDYEGEDEWDFVAIGIWVAFEHGKVDDKGYSII